MSSNRDYQSQITNLQSENKKLKERLETLEKEKQATIKLMELMALDDDILESALILDKYQQENEKLKKVIEILKENPLCIVDVIRFNNYFTYREMYDGVVELTKKDYDLLKEVLGE